MNVFGYDGNNNMSFGNSTKIFSQFEKKVSLKIWKDSEKPSKVFLKIFGRFSKTRRTKIIHFGSRNTHVPFVPPNMNHPVNNESGSTDIILVLCVFLIFENWFNV